MNILRKTAAAMAAVVILGGCTKEEITEVTEVNELKAQKFTSEVCINFDNGFGSDSSPVPEGFSIETHSLVAYTIPSGNTEARIPLPGSTIEEDFLGDVSIYDLRYEWIGDDLSISGQNNLNSEYDETTCFMIEWVFVPTE